jgi:hypothetical protein
MSVSYMTTKPMTLAEARIILEQAGCTIENEPDGFVVSRDGKNYFHIGNDSGITMHFRDGRLQFSYHPPQVDGTSRVLGVCYGSNDPSEFVGLLDMVSEHDDAYQENTGPRLPSPGPEDDV